jgi:hypothetical protein
VQVFDDRTRTPLLLSVQLSIAVQKRPTACEERERSPKLRLGQVHSRVSAGEARSFAPTVLGQYDAGIEGAT